MDYVPTEDPREHAMQTMSVIVPGSPDAWREWTIGKDLPNDTYWLTVVIHPDRVEIITAERGMVNENVRTIMIGKKGE